MDNFLRFLEKELLKIRPDNAERGCCLACANQARLLLTSPVDEYTPRIIDFNTIDLDEFDEMKVLGEEIIDNAIKFNVKKKTDKYFFDYLKAGEKVPCGSVLIADLEDHVYVIFKTYQDKIYLLDSDDHVFKELNSAKDFQGKEYNYYYDVEDGNKIKLYNLGRADPSWQKKEISLIEEASSDFKEEARKASGGFKLFDGAGKEPAVQEQKTQEKEKEKQSQNSLKKD